MLRNREKFACEAAFFFLFRRAVFRKSCLLETFHIWIGKNCDLVATINSLPHFDWKHAVLTLTPEYQVYFLTAVYRGCGACSLPFSYYITPAPGAT